MELRPYQIDISEKAVKILRSKQIVYISSEVRTGKTLMALNTVKLYGAKRVLFLTKKKAIQSILDDYNNFGYSESFELVVINNESMNKVICKFDLVIHDESHRFGSFPKPSKGAKDFKVKFMHLPIILLSGTPTPENYSQIFHQFWISYYSPFGHGNFYSWAKTYVNVKQKHLGYGIINDYTEAKQDLIKPILKDYFVTFTQKEAGFTSEVIERVMYCEMKPITYQLIKQLKKDLVIEGEKETILADTAVKLMSKCHQLFSGTIKFESGKRQVIDHSKALFIQEKFGLHKIAIFYKFTAELQALQDVFGNDITTDLEEFNETSKNIALQIVSGREGISLKMAKYLIYYNMDFSATSYWQSRDRLTTMDRLSNEIFYIFARGGIEQQIFESVKKKKTYTSSYFIKNNGIKIPNKTDKIL
jgi:hypothetical protein